MEQAGRRRRQCTEHRPDASTFHAQKYVETVNMAAAQHLTRLGDACVSFSRSEAAHDGVVRSCARGR